MIYLRTATVAGRREMTCRGVARDASCATESVAKVSPTRFGGGGGGGKRQRRGRTSEPFSGGTDAPVTVKRREHRHGADFATANAKARHGRYRFPRVGVSATSVTAVTTVVPNLTSANPAFVSAIPLHATIAATSYGRLVALRRSENFRLPRTLHSCGNKIENKNEYNTTCDDKLAHRKVNDDGTYATDIMICCR